MLEVSMVSTSCENFLQPVMTSETDKAISRVTQRKLVKPVTIFLNTPYNAYSKTDYTIARFGVIRQDDDESQTGAVAKWMK